MNTFHKFLTKAHSRLEEIQKDPYADPAIDVVTVAMLIENVNTRARKAGCGHLTMATRDIEKDANPAECGMLGIQKMIDWCEVHAN